MRYSYRVFGGLRFFERQEVKHALAYLRLLASDDDAGALLRVINFPRAALVPARSNNCRISRRSAAQLVGGGERKGSDECRARSAE